MATSDPDKNQKIVEIWPDTPVAYLRGYEMTRAKKHQLGVDEIKNTVIPKMLKDCPSSKAAHALAVDILMRYDLFDEAIQLIEQSLPKWPESPEFYSMLAHCFRAMAERMPDEEGKIEMRKQALVITKHLKQVSRQHDAESTNWMYMDMASIPTPHE